MATDWLMPSEVEGSQRATDDKEELFVFGYACKVFRDDEKATFIDQGQHLIPWMGDERLQIDRYDGRGHLYDLSPYDASKVKETELTDDQRQIEQLCDEERYLELRTDVAEKNMYEEEEWKRYYESLSEGYNAVGFSYDYQQQQEQYAQQQQLAAALEAEKPFLVPKELQLPPNIKAPDTEKVNAIIEKTAKFVAKQGMQMEIIVKTKQANNAQFCFLHYDDELHPYYKHMVSMIKSGKYKPKEEVAEEETDDKDNEEDDHHGYLHPSLLSKNRASPALSLAPDVPLSKPIEMPKISIHDTPYGQLIKTLAKKHPPQEASISKANETQDATGHGDRTKTPPPLKPPPIPPYLSQPEYGPTHPGLPPPPGLEPVTLPIPASDQPPPPGTDIEGLVLSARNSPAFDEDSSSRDSPLTTLDQIIPPPPDVQPVIDRMAMYVAKNGIEFEIVVKSKKDTRFEFLEPYHVHFPYYNFKKQIHMREAAKERARKENEKPTKLSFSIKTKNKEQDNFPREKKKKVFDHESDEEGDPEDRERLSLSGTSTPLGSEYGFFIEEKSEKPQIPQEEKEKRLAEERLKDRLAQGAREKMAQASREKQMQAERKRKAAMFINMLKSCNPAADVEEATKDAENAKSTTVTTPIVTPSCSPGRCPDVKETNDHDSATRYSKRSQDSGKASRSRSRSPRRRRRSPTPPSAYHSLVRSQSPQRISPWGNRAPSPPRRRERSRSPRTRRSRSPSYSAKKPRISPPRREYTGDKDSSSRSSRKSKKKKKSRSKSRSPSHSSRSRQKSADPDVIITGVTKANPIPDGASIYPANLPESSARNICGPRLDENESTQSVPSNRLPPIPESGDGISAHSRLSPSVAEAEDSNSATSDSRSGDSQKNVSNYMLHRVRALIKASRQAILKEDGPLYDDT